MTMVQVDSLGLWRYPVKSMNSEQLEEAFVGFSGVYGDRLFAFTSTACPKGFSYLTRPEQRKMLLYSLLIDQPSPSRTSPCTAW